MEDHLGFRQTIFGARYDAERAAAASKLFMGFAKLRGKVLSTATTIAALLSFALTTPGYSQIANGIGVSTIVAGSYSTQTTSACGTSAGCTVTGSSATPAVCNLPTQTLVVPHVATAQALVTSQANACIAYINNVLQAFYSKCPAGSGYLHPIVAGPWSPAAVDPATGSVGGGSGGSLTSAGFFTGSLAGEAGCASVTSTTTVGGVVSAGFDDWWCIAAQFPVASAPIDNCSTAPPLTVTLFDPIADNLASGTGLVSNLSQLAAASRVVQGVAADSATQVLVQISGSYINAGDQIQSCVRGLALSVSRRKE